MNDRQHKPGRGLRVPCPVCFVALLAVLGLAVPSRGGMDTEALVARAQTLELHEEGRWRTLLHIAPGEDESLIDDPRFFLAPDGKRDPRAELTATIRAVFSTEEAPPAPVPAEPKPSPYDDVEGQVAIKDDPYRCRFPARFEFLRERLEVSASELDPVACPRLNEALVTLEPHSATLVFASAHMNSPASMFGHTFLRIDKAKRSPLLSHTVNYAAEVDETDTGLAYAVKGLAGFYPGYYTILPYYEKVREYGNIDHRDIWEYRLALTPGEVRQLSLHAWELQDIWADYFFFDENCSYGILYLLDVARPGLGLAARFRAWVAPPATVEAVVAAGLVEEVVYRPSQARKIQRLARGLDSEGVALARRLRDDEATPGEVARSGLDDAQKARILEIDSELVHGRYLAGEMEPSDYKGRLLKTLSARSKLKGVEIDREVATPRPPHEGHSTGRLTVAGGSVARDGFWELGWRPAQHDLTDPVAGYLEGAQIQFVSLAGRYYPGAQKARLHEVKLLDILSASPRTRLASPISWALSTGVRTRPFSRDDRPHDEKHVVYLEGGAGLAWELGPMGIFYLLGGPELQLSREFGGDDTYGTLGVAAFSGLAFNPSESLRFTVEGRATTFVAGDEPHPEMLALAGLTWVLWRNGVLRTEAARSVASERYATELRAAFQFYY